MTNGNQIRYDKWQNWPVLELNLFYVQNYEVIYNTLLEQQELGYISANG